MTLLPLILFYSERSPFARRCRIALNRAHLPFEAQVVNVFEPSPTLLETNPLGTVPVLVTDSATPLTITDSAAILEFIHDTTQSVWSSDIILKTKERYFSTLCEGIMTQTVAYYLETIRATPDEIEKQEILTTIARTLDRLEFLLTTEPHYASHAQNQTDLIIACDYAQLRIKNFIETFFNTTPSTKPTLLALWNLHKDHPTYLASRPKL